MRKPLAALAAAALVLGVGGTATASAAPSSYDLCVNKKTGVPRFVNATKACLSVEKRVVVPNADELRIPVSGPGAQGPRGPQGARGETGPAGPVGPMGPRGFRGAPGRTGAQGEPGKNGQDGADGKNGGVVTLESITIDLSVYRIPGVGKLTCSGNTSTDPARPAFSTCAKGGAPSPAPTATPTPTSTPLPSTQPTQAP